MSRCYLMKGDKDAALDELEKSLGYAEAYEIRSDVNRYEPCWLSEAEDHMEFTSKHSTKTSYDELKEFISEGNCFEELGGNARFEEILARLKTLME